MPTGYGTSKSLGIGAGIARGAGAFVDSFLRVKALKHQEKMQKNASIVQLLTKQLEDENLTGYERAKILDSIPQLIGAKMERPLSQMLGIDKLNEQTVEDQPGKPKQVIQGQGTFDQGSLTPNQAGSAGESPITPSGSPVDLGSITTKPTEGSVTARGNLTPAIIKKKLILETERASNEMDIDKATRLARINNDLQMESLKALGYNQIISKGFNEQGNYVVTAMNQSGQTKTIDLGKTAPEAIIRAGIGSDRPSKSIQAMEDYWQTQIDPTTGTNFTQEKAYAKALEDAHTAFALQQQTRAAYTQSIQQGISGTKPIQPAQAADDARANAQMRLQVQKDVDEATSKAQSTFAEVQRLTSAKDSALEALKTARAEFDSANGEFTPDDPEWKAANRKLERAESKYNKLDEELRKANSSDILAKSILEGAKGRLNQVGSSTGAYSPQVQAAIDQVRKNNPQQTANMSNEEIYNYLKAHGKVK